MSTNSRKKSDGFPLSNEEITAKTVRVIDDEGEMLGIISISEAMRLALEKGLDLVEISPNNDPPVCKIMDFGKFKYQAKKKAHDAKKKQKQVELKEIKLRPTIGEHDFQIKMKSVGKFIEEGNKVKITLRFKGREIVHQEIGMELLQRVVVMFEEITKLEYAPKMEGKQLLMILAPK